jgi:tryptophan synthase alpha chain
VPFFTAGFPNLAATEQLVKGSVNAGADIIELGMPFSDPLADGPQIQLSSKIALENGISIVKILNQVSKIRRFTVIPIVLMGYYNPIIAFGQEKFFKAAADSGVSGFILADLPVDEAGFAISACQKHNLSLIFLVSPTSTPYRLKMADKFSTDLVYAVTVTGVTGTGKLFDRSTDRYLKRLHNVLGKKFVAGFGVASPESATRLTRYADGVVIGSALVPILNDARTISEGVRGVESFLSTIRKVI